jgi:hypothetical protein
MSDIEFAEPTAQGRRNLLALYVTGAIVGALLVLVVRPRLFEFVGGLPVCEQSQWSLGLLVACLSVVPVAAVGTIFHAKRLLRFNQSPLPNAWVLRRTQIRRGRPVRVQAYALFVCSACFLAGALYLAYLLRPMFSAMRQHCGA